VSCFTCEYEIAGRDAVKTAGMWYSSATDFCVYLVRKNDTHANDEMVSHVVPKPGSYLPPSFFVGELFET